MRATRTFTILLILALLLSSVPTTGLRPTRAAEPEVGTAPTARTVEPLNDTDATEPWPFGVFSSPSAPSAIQSPAGNWHIECVDCPKQFAAMTDRSLRLDGEGHPHITYGGDHLYYAWHDGMQWHYETVDESPDVGRFASLVLHGSGRPHISYVTGYPRNLKYAWYDGANWHHESVDSGVRWGSKTSLALDRAGRPHIGYSTDYPSDLKHAWHDGTTWHIETVDSDAGGCISLALDGAGRPHISYHWWGVGLKYAWHDGTGWHVETVDSEGGEHTSLALDGAGRPHISYLDMTNDDLKYAWYDGTSWQIKTVDSDGSVGWDTSLALDGAGQPHVSYFDGYPNTTTRLWNRCTVFGTARLETGCQRCVRAPGNAVQKCANGSKLEHLCGSLVVVLTTT